MNPPNLLPRVEFSQRKSCRQPPNETKQMSSHQVDFRSTNSKYKIILHFLQGLFCYFSLFWLFPVFFRVGRVLPVPSSVYWKREKLFQPPCLRRAKKHTGFALIGGRFGEKEN